MSTLAVIQPTPTPAATDTIILWTVIAARFLIPLLIPRFPLPGVLAALVLDAADQTIFQTWTHLPLDNYQNYDKALDIYYLTIAYIATIRNWSNEFGFHLGQFLFYYRLVGALLFELTGLRAALLFFPNVFEYYFIAYEVLRLRWNPVRLQPVLLLGLASAIWVFIKVPQEYWIHIAQRDVTDTVAELVVRAAGTGWETVIRLWPLWLALVVLVAALAVRWALRRLPPPDGPGSLDADRDRERFSPQQVEHARAVWSRTIFDRDLLEKVVLLSLISVIFGQILPGVAAGPWVFAVAIAVFVTINTVTSHWLSRRGMDFSRVVRQFVVMLAVNTALALLYLGVGRLLGVATSAVNAAFFTLLISLLITLFDRYQHDHLARFPAAWS
jgi:hypothetical protein